jgi:hypothetical protein
MEQNKILGAAGFNFGPIVICSIHNDLHKAIENKAIPMLFADDTSILIIGPNNIQFESDLNVVSGQLNNWFKVNLHSLNFEKTYFIQFTNKIT